MWPRAEQLLLTLVVLSAAVFGGPAHGSTSLLDGELGAWLDGQVAPDLAETLSRHPMFKGETLRFVSLTNGVPSRTSTELNEAIERRLTQHLLTREGIRLALDRPGDVCAAPRTIDYVIGIEVAPTGSRQARLNLGIIDVADSVWVSGVSYQWQGRLSTSERLALANPVVTAHPGSADSPLPLEDAIAIATAFRQRLRCVLPLGLEGPLFLPTSEDDQLARIGLALQSELLTSPLASVTADRRDARWVMTLDRDPVAGQIQEVRLNLQDEQGRANQRLAAVFVAAADSRPPRPQAARTFPSEAAPPLLTALRLRPAEAVGVCDSGRARVNTCVEVEFELRESAYLMVFSTQARHLGGVDCDARPSSSKAGMHRYRMRVPPGRIPPASPGTLTPVDEVRAPDAGLYVLATKDADTARSIQQALREGPGSCGHQGSVLDGWLATLDQVVQSHGEKLTWRAIHLAHETEGVVRL